MTLTVEVKMFSKKKPSEFDAYGFPKVIKETVEETIGYAIGKSELGLILVASSEFGIVSVLNSHHKDDLLQQLELHFPKRNKIRNEYDAKRALSEVLKLIERPDYNFVYPILIDGTAFQRRVWQAVQEVLPGKTATYSEIAKKIGAPRAMRAVGSSCTRSKLFFIVPCHRIVRNDYKASDSSGGKAPFIGRDMLLARENKTVVEKKKSSKK